MIVLGDSVPAIRALHGALPIIEQFPRVSVMVNCGDSWRDAALELLHRHGHHPEQVSPMAGSPLETVAVPFCEPPPAPAPT